MKYSEPPEIEHRGMELKFLGKEPLSELPMEYYDVVFLAVDNPY